MRLETICGRTMHEISGRIMSQVRLAILVGALTSCSTPLGMPFAPISAWAKEVAVVDQLEPERARLDEKMTFTKMPSRLIAAYESVADADDETLLKKMSEMNSKLSDKSIKRVLDAGIDMANRAADPETQQVDEELLHKAEERFTLVIDELAPNFVGGYTNRANVRIVLRDYEGAVQDYTTALRLAPLGNDAWLVKVNRGLTLLAMGRTSDALDDLQQAVPMSKGDPVALLGRGAVLHKLGQYAAAASDYGAVVAKSPADVQPYWLRYGLELWQVDRKPEALGILRRVAAKFDLEPECALAVSSLLNVDGVTSDKDEAMRRWKLLPAIVREKALEVDVVGREWPPSAMDAAAVFLKEVGSSS